jgi:hypothetical protein
MVAGQGAEAIQVVEGDLAVAEGHELALAQLPQGAVEVDGCEPQYVREHVLVQRAGVALV